MISAQIDRVRRVVVAHESVASVYEPLAIESVLPIFRSTPGELRSQAHDRFRDDLIFVAATYFEAERQQQLQPERRGDA